jgi:hypothetical protein
MRRLNHDGRLRETPVVKPRPVQTREPAENLAVCGALNARTRLKFLQLTECLLARFSDSCYGNTAASLANFDGSHRGAQRCCADRLGRRIHRQTFDLARVTHAKSRTDPRRD